MIAPGEEIDRGLVAVTVVVRNEGPASIISRHIAVDVNNPTARIDSVNPISNGARVHIPRTRPTVIIACGGVASIRIKAHSVVLYDVSGLYLQGIILLGLQSSVLCSNGNASIFAGYGRGPSQRSICSK